jgi:Thioredoxin-like
MAGIGAVESLCLWRCGGKVQTSRLLRIGILSAICPCAALAQTASGRPSSRAVYEIRPAPSFAPIQNWDSAVMTGNQTALAALYTTNPPAQTETPRGVTQDPGEEARFWSALAGNGLSDFQPKVLAVEHRPQGVIEVVLRVMGQVRTSSGKQPFVVEIHQRWLQQEGIWRIFSTRRSDLSASPDMRLPEPAKPNTALYAPPADAQAEIRAALASAAKDHKRVILVFGANWCYDCHVLDTAFHSPAIAPLVNANYHVVHINVGDDGDQNLDLAEHYGVPLKQAVRIPSLAVLDPDGKLIYSQKQGEFDDSTRLGPADVTAFLKKWAPSHQG